MSATARRWDAALTTRPSAALDVLTGVIVPRHDDIPGEVENARAAAYAPERLATFEGRAGRLLVVKLPARRVDVDPFTAAFREQFVSAFRTRDGLLVWDVLVKAGLA